MKSFFRYIVLSILFSGCMFHGKNSPSIAHPAAIVNSSIQSAETGNKIEQKGDAAVPAQVNTQKEEIKFTIPKGSELTWDQMRKEFRLMFVADSPAQASHLSESLKAPQSFEPASPLSIAQAEAFPLYIKVAIALALAGGLILWSGHYMAGGILIAAGFFLPIFGRVSLAFQAPPWSLPILLMLGTSLGLVGGWYVLKKRFPTQFASIEEKSESTLSKVESQLKTV